MLKTKSFKIYSWVVVIILLSIVLAGCSNTRTDVNKMSVTVTIATVQEVLLSEIISINEGSTADKAIVAACQSKKLAYTLKDGMFDYFGTIASTQTDGWLFYINGELADIGAAQYIIKAGDALEFKYENYDDAFTLY